MTEASPNLKVKALELANQHAEPHASVVARAESYHSFLSGTATAPAATKAATPPAANKPATGAPATKPATAPAGAKPSATPPAGAKPAAAAAKPAAAPAASSGATKAPGGKHTQAEVRALIQKVAIRPGEGNQAARDILSESGGGVATVSALKPEFFDAVFEACQNILAEGGAGGGDDDPTA